ADATLRGPVDRAYGQDVVAPPADVAATQFPPRRPPREQSLVVGIKFAGDVDQVAAEESFEQIALLLPLADDVGLALPGVDVDVGPGDVDVAAEDELTTFGVHLLHPFHKVLHKADLRGVVLAAVGNVDRGDHQIVQRTLHDARLDVEVGMAEFRFLQQFALEVQRHARIASAAVPEGVVIAELAALRHLVGTRFDLLQAHHVGAVALQPLAKLRLARANAVDVPGGYFHAGSDVTLVPAANRTAIRRRRRIALATGARPSARSPYSSPSRATSDTKSASSAAIARADPGSRCAASTSAAR